MATYLGSGPIAIYGVLPAPHDSVLTAQQKVVAEQIAWEKVLIKALYNEKKAADAAILARQKRRAGMLHLLHVAFKRMQMIRSHIREAAAEPADRGTDRSDNDYRAHNAVAFRPDPGTRWVNPTNTVWYQLVSSLRNPCPLCLARHGHVSPRPWDIPYHEHCECEQIEVPPGYVSVPIDFCRCCMRFICDRCEARRLAKGCETWEKTIDRLEARARATDDLVRG